jgi:hypothetical protein
LLLVRSLALPHARFSVGLWRLRRLNIAEGDKRHSCTKRNNRAAATGVDKPDYTEFLKGKRAFVQCR